MGIRGAVRTLSSIRTGYDHATGHTGRCCCPQAIEEPGEDTSKYDVFMPTVVKPKSTSNGAVPTVKLEVSINWFWIPLSEDILTDVSLKTSVSGSGQILLKIINNILLAPKLN